RRRSVSAEPVPRWRGPEASPPTRFLRPVPFLFSLRGISGAPDRAAGEEKLLSASDAHERWNDTHRDQRSGTGTDGNGVWIVAENCRDCGKDDCENACVRDCVGQWPGPHVRRTELLFEPQPA